MTTIDKTKIKLEKNAERATRWIGSTKSLVAHSILFATCFTLPFFGVNIDRVLLVLTTAVSLEAIYLAIFIQMTVNKNSADIEDIQEDVDDIQEKVEDIEEVHEEDYKQDRELEMKEHEVLNAIQISLKQLSEEIEQLKKK